MCIRDRFNEAGRPDVHISVDGGINADTAKQVVANGATAMVAGNFVYGASDLGKAIQDLKAAGKSAPAKEKAALK